MAHFVRTHTNSEWTVGGAGSYVTLQSDWQDLADKAFKAINGDKGGTWAPSSLLTINTGGFNCTGPALVNFGGIVKTIGGRFILGSTDWPKLGSAHVGRTRTIRTSVMTRQCTPRYHFLDCPTHPGSIQSIACTVINATTGLEQPRCHILLRVQDGARLVSGVLHFRVPLPRTKAPKQMPKLRIIRVDEDGKIESLNALSDTVDVNGFFSQEAVTSGDEWFALGAAKTWEFTCDQNNTIDTSLYTYYAELIEEAGATDITKTDVSSADGTLLRERKTDVTYVYLGIINSLSGIPGVNPPFEGPTLGDADGVLFAVDADYTKNGIWYINAAGEWVRSPELTAGSDFTSGFIVFDRNKSQLWECYTPTTGGQAITVDNLASTPPVNVVGATPIRFRRRQPRGNIYHSIVCTFDSISDMRPE